jgi:hypothetical protein
MKYEKVNEKRGYKGRNKIEKIVIKAERHR